VVIGAVYAPLEVMMPFDEPPGRDHVTAAFLLPVTVAWKLTVPPGRTCAACGVTVTWTPTTALLVLALVLPLPVPLLLAVEPSVSGCESRVMSAAGWLLVELPQ
jgi:hypothetical protein